MDDVVEGVTVVVVVVFVVDEEIVVLDVVNGDDTIFMSDSDMGESAAANKGSF